LMAELESDEEAPKAKPRAAKNSAAGAKAPTSR
jgi:outer membrane murein-binding lipoprotein Lpp